MNRIDGELFARKDTASYAGNGACGGTSLASNRSRHRHQWGLMMTTRFSLVRRLLASTVLSGLVLLAPATLAQDAALKGKSITVLLPGEGFPEEVISKFESETGINVDQQTLAWDQLRTRIVTALVAGTAPADVIELDWSWVGQFGAAGWLTPLDGIVDADALADIAVTSIFQYEGATLGAPYNNDFKMMVANTEHMAAAGVEEMPKTVDELLAAGRAIKEAGVVEYPFGFPLSVGEATSTGWFLVTMMFGGDLFNEDMTPAFTDPESGGYKALEFIKAAVDEGLIDPAATSFGNPEVQNVFRAGDTSFILSDGPGGLAVLNNPELSTVAGHAEASVITNVTGNTRTYGLPEALGIPASASEKEAAAAFINFMMEPENQVIAYKEQGILSTSSAALQSLNSEGLLLGGDAILAQLEGVGPLFASGTPQWYPEFSSAAASAINEVAKGTMSVPDAIQAIADAASNAVAGI
jgi:multiple sugar transport system substrate-binding protein